MRKRLFVDGLEQRTLLATYTVTSTADTTASGTLRWAITQANNTSSVVDTITFAIGTGAKSIALTSALPAILSTVTIDGTSQPGFAGAPLIELNGTAAGTGANGLLAAVGTATIRGLVINRFKASGIRAEALGSVVVKGCYIGTNSAAASASANAHGTYTLTANNIIGGTNAADRNVISGNAGSGIYFSSASSQNTVSGNYIGTNAAGTASVGNTEGVTIYGANNRIGTEAAGGGNVISGNSYDGITIIEIGGTQIAQNRIGANAAGTAALPNGVYGIWLSASYNTTIGGTATSAGGTPAARNQILGGAGAGILLQSSSATSVLGNVFGLTANGLDFIGGGTYAIDLSDSFDIEIGSNANGAGNIFGSANTASVHIGGENSFATVASNQFGIPSEPTIAWAGPTGVIIDDTYGSTTIGGELPGQGNIFLNLSGDGIVVRNNERGGLIAGNIIGSDSAFADPYAGVDTGVILDGTTGWIVSKNDIVNSSYGIKFLATTQASVDNAAYRNRIGGDRTLNRGNRNDGVLVNLAFGGNGLRIGSHASDGPYGAIAHNGGAGVRVQRGAIRISTHEIYDNGGKGIVLAAAAAKQPAPTIISATRGAASTPVSFTLSGLVPDEFYNVDFFRTDVPDPSGAGEGEVYLTARTFWPNASGTITFTQQVDAAIGTFVTATATHDSVSGGTSEFSTAVRVTAAPVAPTVTLAQFERENNHAIRIRFDQNVTASLSASDLTITSDQTGQPINQVPVFLASTTNGTITAGTWTFFNTNLLPDGNYTATLPAGSVQNATGQTNASPTVLRFHVLAGDLNADRMVNFSDLLTLAQNYGTTGKTFSQGNIDYSANGSVNFSDLLMLAQRYGTTLAAPQAADVAMSRDRAAKRRSSNAADIIA